MPLLDELIIGCREIINKLIVKVYDVVDHVVADDWFLSCYQLLNDLGESHLILE